MLLSSKAKNHKSCSNYSCRDPYHRDRRTL